MSESGPNRRRRQTSIRSAMISCFGAGLEPGAEQTGRKSCWKRTRGDNLMMFTRNKVVRTAHAHQLLHTNIYIVRTSVLHILTLNTFSLSTVIGRLLKLLRYDVSVKDKGASIPVIWSFWMPFGYGYLKSLRRISAVLCLKDGPGKVLPPRANNSTLFREWPLPEFRDSFGGEAAGSETEREIHKSVLLFGGGGGHNERAEELPPIITTWRTSVKKKKFKHVFFKYYRENFHAVVMMLAMQEGRSNNHGAYDRTAVVDRSQSQRSKQQCQDVRSVVITKPERNKIEGTVNAGKGYHSVKSQSERYVSIGVCRLFCQLRVLKCLNFGLHSAPARERLEVRDKMSRVIVICGTHRLGAPAVQDALGAGVEGEAADGDERGRGAVDGVDELAERRDVEDASQIGRLDGGRRGAGEGDEPRAGAGDPHVLAVGDAQQVLSLDERHPVWHLQRQELRGPRDHPDEASMGAEYPSATKNSPEEDTATDVGWHRCWLPDPGSSLCPSTSDGRVCPGANLKTWCRATSVSQVLSLLSMARPCGMKKRLLPQSERTAPESGSRVSTVDTAMGPSATCWKWCDALKELASHTLGPRLIASDLGVSSNPGPYLLCRRSRMPVEELPHFGIEFIAEVSNRSPLGAALGQSHKGDCPQHQPQNRRHLD
ncbi:hypothetical protein C0J52_05526 [Blattella germanica]|nr:hypothetical protein C0J52_05526 [Blattella germanica]